MKTLTVEIADNVEITEQVAAQTLTQRERINAFVELTKPRIAVMLLLTAAAGFYLGTKSAFNFILFANSMIGIVLLAFGVSTLNQFIERRTDKLMNRTKNRPLPSGKLKPWQALTFGLFLTILAEVYLAVLVNPLTAVLGVSVIVGYVLLYTPLKTRTSLSTVVGAFPGAMPPLMGWTSASNEITMGAFALFTIIFLWQFPHFLAIAWMYREDYGKAGILMLPVVEPSGKITAQQIVVFTILLIPISFAPFFIGLAGWFYLVGAILLGAYFLWNSIKAAREKSNEQARKLLLASVLYLPLLFGLMVLNRL